MLETALEKAESAAGQAEAGQVNASSWMYSETVKAEKSPEISHLPFSEAQNLSTPVSSKLDTRRLIGSKF